MAAIASTTSGLSNAGTTWAGGVVPTSVDTVTIAHPGTNTFSSTPYTTNSAYAVGTTSLPVSGGTGSIVAGECIQLEHQTGTDADGFPVWHTTYYRVATGITGNGTIVIDAPGLQIAIPAGTRVLNCGHVVTLSADHTWGNDTGTGMVINGTLRWPADASRTLTVRANYVVNGSGTEDRGEPDRPIPQGFDAVLVLNDSGTLAVAKYSATFNAGSRCRQHGATRTRRTTLTAQATTGATSIQVADATGWQVGDEIVSVGTSQGSTSANALFYTTIAAGYTPGALTVPLSAAIPLTRASGGWVGNLTSNVRTTHPANFGYGQYRFNEGSTGRLLDKRVTNAAFISTNPNFIQQHIWQGGESSGFLLQVVAAGCVVRGETSAEIIANLRGAVVNRSLIHSRTTLSANALESGPVRLTDSMIVGRPPIVASSNPSALQRFSGVWCVAFVDNSAGLNWSTINGRLVNCQFLNLGQFSPSAVSTFAGPNSEIIGCNFAPFASVSAAGALPILAGGLTRVFSSTFGRDPWVQPTYGSFTGSSIESVDGNYTGTADTPRTEGWANEASFRSVTTPRKNGITALQVTNRLTIQGFIRPYNRAQVVPIPANSTRLLLVNLRRTASGTMPVVSVSGSGITTVTSSVSNTADVWQEASLSIVNPTSAVVQATITITCAGALNTDSFVDGLVDYPFIQSVRWYGYQFDEANIFRTVDPTITLTEAAAAAVTGVAINHTTQTITITAARTAAEVYCFCMLDLVNNLDGSGNYRTRHITSSGGVVTTTYTVTLSGAGAISGGQIVAANGATGLISITGLTGGSANAQIWVGNDAGVQQDFQPSVTGSYSYSIPFGATGIWRVVVNKPGYFPQIFNITPGQTTALNISLEPILNPDGTVLYTGASTPISATFVTAGDYDLHFGTEVTIQQIFDSSQDAYSTAAGMAWLGAGNSELRVIKTNIGQFAFLPLRTRLFGTALPAAVAGFVTSEDGIVVDTGTTFPIRFAQPPANGATAADVWAFVTRTLTADPGAAGHAATLAAIAAQGVDLSDDIAAARRAAELAAALSA